MADLDSQLQEQERIINISYALASEASQRSKQVAGEAAGAASEAGSQPLLPGFKAQPSPACQELVGKQVSGLEIEEQWCLPCPLQDMEGAGLVAEEGSRPGRGTGAQGCWRKEVWERACGSLLDLGAVLLFRSL